MSRLPFVLRQAVAAGFVCLIVGSAASGCAPQKPGTPSPSPTPSGPVPYAKSAALAANLAVLDSVAGSIQGTMTIGSVERPLSGSVNINGGSTQIRLAEGGTTQDIYSEMVVDGHRYTSRDDKIWVDRGTKARGTDLKSVLGVADTAIDSGVSKVSGVSAHKILTIADKVDVAPALGIDTWTFDEESTTLRIWADDSGKPVGFGASMSWKVTLGGVAVPVTADLDVMFKSTTPAEIVAPTKFWQWKDDRASGIAFGYPATLDQTGLEYQLVYKGAAVGQMSLAQFTKEFVDSLNVKPSGSKSIVIGSEDGLWMTVHLTSQHLYEFVALVVHETMAYGIFIAGDPADEAAFNNQAFQILASVEFTR